MDSWEWNKIAGAVLGTLIFVMVIGIFSEAVYERAGRRPSRAMSWRA